MFWAAGCRAQSDGPLAAKPSKARWAAEVVGAPEGAPLGRGPCGGPGWRGTIGGHQSLGGSNISFSPTLEGGGHGLLANVTNT